MTVLFLQKRMTLVRIEIYLDDDASPFEVIVPPNQFIFDSTGVSDGKHRLTFIAISNDGESSHREVDFSVRNGPSITVHGLHDGECLSGEISILTNAYNATAGDNFEPVRMETPAPIPTWAWVLVLVVLAWGAGYISIEMTNHINPAFVQQIPPQPALSVSANENSEVWWKDLGQQVYGNNCVACHQADGRGLPGVFPPLVDNPAVIKEDASEHILAILNGVAGKTIEGIAYASPMPGFAELLDDQEIASVVNHERTQWGNNSATVTAEHVRALR